MKSKIYGVLTFIYKIREDINYTLEKTERIKAVGQKNGDVWQLLAVGNLGLLLSGGHSHESQEETRQFGPPAD